MNKITLKLKVTLWYTGILIMVSFLILYAMIVLSETVVIKEMEGQLISSVESFSHKVLENNQKAMVIPEHHLYEKGVQMVLYDKNNVEILGESPYGIDNSITLQDKYLRLETFNNKDYYLYDREVKFGMTDYWVRGVVCLSDELRVIEITAHYYFIFILLFALLAGLGGYFIISRAFVPVNKIRSTAKEISESSDLSRRINMTSGDEEIFTLAETFDSMLEKLESSFDKEKQFTSDASHELRTPISVILSECEYGEECVDTVEEFKEVVGSIKEQASKMSKLVSELLMISRMDNNRLKLNFEDVDLSELLTFVCEEQREIQTKSIVLKENIMPALYSNVDRLLITRLFVNLISNAYQYSDENTTILVSLMKENDKIVFSVKDEGIGISEENVSKIWDRFYQVDSSRTDERNGSSGLGLSMVKWISDCHKGELKVESVLGQGSTFSFILGGNIDV